MHRPFLVLPLSAFLFTACSSGGNDSSGSLQPTADLNGTWATNLTITSTEGNDCDSRGVEDFTGQPLTIQFNRSTSEVELVGVATGTLDGLAFNGSANQSFGTASASVSVQLTFTPNGLSFTGTGTTVTNDSSTGANCTFRYNLTGTLTTPAGGGGDGSAGDPLSINLSWNNDADFDLLIDGPGNEDLAFGSTTMVGGGSHSGDRIPCFSSVPNEEFADYSTPVAGTYFVEGDLRALCNNDPTQAVLTIVSGGGTPIVTVRDFNPGDQRMTITDTIELR